MKNVKRARHLSINKNQAASQNNNNPIQSTNTCVGRHTTLLSERINVSEKGLASSLRK